MKEIVDTLSIPLGVELYPHQRESVEAYVRGKHIVVATGTTQVKLNAF